MTMQLNYFTNFIKINDRIVIGGVDIEDKSNNTLFKVKAIVKANSNRTFAKPGTYELENIPLIILGLDRDVADEEDDFYNRIAVQSPIYPIPVIPEKDNIPTDNFVVNINDPLDKTLDNTILLGQTIEREINLANAELEEDSEFEFEVDLLGVPKIYKKNIISLK